MARIEKPDNKPLQNNAGLMLPARFVPSFRVCKAIEGGVKDNLLIRMHGGLGDVVCAEPAVRYAMTHFKKANFTLATMYPGLFQHLKFEKVFTQANASELNLDKYLMYENTDTGNELAAEFICHTLMHGIDYASLYMWRLLLPLSEREIKLIPTEEEYNWAKSISKPRDIIIHPGKTWKTRTFPKNWWDCVISTIIKHKARPVIIGGVVDNGRASTVDINVPDEALDLRYKCSLMQSVALMHNTAALLTNDSAPLHMATTGDTWIGFLSTVKHSDHIYTYRTPSDLKLDSKQYNGIWAWRMEDMALGRAYEEIDVSPNQTKTVRVDEIETIELLKWLCAPERFAEWALDKLESK